MELSKESVEVLSVLAAAPDGKRSVDYIASAVGKPCLETLGVLYDAGLVIGGKRAAPVDVGDFDIILGDYIEYSITGAGRNALSYAEEQIKHNAEDKAYKDAQQHWQEQSDLTNDLRHKGDVRRSWFQFWLGLLIGWVIGGFTMDTVVHFFTSILH